MSSQSIRSSSALGRPAHGATLVSQRAHNSAHCYSVLEMKSKTRKPQDTVTGNSGTCCSDIATNRHIALMAINGHYLILISPPMGIVSMKPFKTIRALGFSTVKTDVGRAVELLGLIKIHFRPLTNPDRNWPTILCQEF